VQIDEFVPASVRTPNPSVQLAFTNVLARLGAHSPFKMVELLSNNRGHCQSDSVRLCIIVSKD